MTSSSTLTAVLLAISAGCSARSHVASSGTAVPAAMQRQVLNAADAGDGDYQTKVLRSAVVADPGNLAARLELADRYWKAGVFELAIEHYRSALDRFPDHANVAFLLARTLRDSDQAPAAIDVLVKFCERNPKPSPDLLSLLGILKDDSGQLGGAEAAYRAAIQEAPVRADLRINLGCNLLLQGKAALAVEQFQEALKIEPHSQLAHDNLGMALLAQWKDDSQPTEALLHWQSVSDPASAHNNLATVLIEQGRYKEARKELEIALSYRQDHPAALRNLALVSELDGGSPQPPVAVRNSFWKRVKTVFNSRKSVKAVETASR